LSEWNYDRRECAITPVPVATAIRARHEWFSRGPREASEIEQMLRMQDAAPAARDASMVNWYRQIEPSTR